MSNNVSVNFKVSGSELANYMDQIQKKSDHLTNTAIQNAKDQTNAAKEQLKIANEQLALTEKKNRIEAQAQRSLLLEQKARAEQERQAFYNQERQNIDADFRGGKMSAGARTQALSDLNRDEKEDLKEIRTKYNDQLSTLKEQERQDKLQTQLSREQLQVSRDAAREQVKEIRSGNKTLEDVYREAGETNEEEKLTLRLIEEELNKDKKKEDKEASEEKKRNNIVGSILGAENINKVFSTMQQFTQTQNGFDLIQPASNLAGRIIGGVLGAAVGSLAGGVGAVAGASFGATIGGGFGDALGAYEQREATTKENYFKSRNRFRGITGYNTDGMEMFDMQNAGISVTQMLQMQGDYARKLGSRDRSGTTARDAAYLERAYGVEQGTSATIIELQRSAKENNRDLAGLIGGILEKGQGSFFKNGDTTFLNEFLGKFSTLQKELLKSSTTVASGLTMDILKQFNGMGGMFDARDSRSAGLVSSINNSLSNPSSDNMKALAFSVLRRQNPNAGIFDLREEMQKGLGSPAYLKGMLSMIDQIGGDDQMKMNNLSGMFQGVPFAAIRTLFQNRNKLSRFDSSELTSIGIDPSVLKGKAEGNTTDLEKNAAKIENGILGGEAVSKMADAFVTAIKAMLGGAVINLNNGQGTVTLIPNNTVVQQNATRKAAETKQSLQANGINPETLKPVGYGIKY